MAQVRQKWRQMERSLGESLAALGQQLKQTMANELGAQRAPSVSPACRQSFGELADGLAQQRLWASQLVDSSARLPSGLLEGTLTELGNFDQCLSVGRGEEPASSLASAGPSRGQYCSVQVRPALTSRPRLHTVCQPLALALSGSLANQTGAGWRAFRSLAQHSHHFHYVGLRLGLCAPAKCTRSDLQQLLSLYLAKYELLVQVKSCQAASAVPSELDFVQQCIV